MSGAGKSIYDQLYPEDDGGESQLPPPLTPEARAARARAMQSLTGATPAPTTSAPQVASASDGSGFWDQFKKTAVYNAEKFLNFVNDKPQPTDTPPASKGFLGHAGEFAAGVVDPVNMIGFGAGAKLADMAGLPGFAERTAAKIVGRDVLPTLARKTSQYAIEGAGSGAVGQPLAEALRAKEEGRTYDLSNIPKDAATGAAYGAVLDPAFRAAIPAAKIGLAAFDAAYPMPGRPRARTSVFEGVPQGDAAHLDTFDPWDRQRTPNPLTANVGMSDKSIPDLERAGKVIISGTRDAVTEQPKFGDIGDRLDVITPVDPEYVKQKLIAQGVPEYMAESRSVSTDVTQDADGNMVDNSSTPHHVTTDLHITGTPSEKTLHVGWLKHSGGFPLERGADGKVVLDPSSGDPQPLQTPRETAMTMRVIQDQLVKNPDIKWLDTHPINSHVMKLLAKYGGRFEEGGTMVVPAENVREGRKVGIHPETQAILDATASGDRPHRVIEPSADPTGRHARAEAETGKRYNFRTNPNHPMWDNMEEPGDYGPPEDFDPNDVTHMDYNEYDTGGDHDVPQDAEGNLLYSGLPVVPKKGAGKRVRLAVRATVRDLMKDNQERPVQNVEKLEGLSDDARARIKKASEQFRPLQDQGHVPMVDAREAAIDLGKQYAERYSGLDYDRALKLTGVELKAREHAIVQLDDEMTKVGEQMDADPENQQLKDQFQQLQQRQEEIFTDLVPGKSQAGRDLRMLRHAPESLAGWLEKGKKAAGSYILPEDVIAKIKELHQKRKAATDPQVKQLTEDELKRLIEGLKHRPAYQHLIDLFKTAITTPGPIDVANFTANTVQLAAETVSQTVAAFADTVIKLVADMAGVKYDRVVSTPDLLEIGRGARHGHQDAKAILRTGISEHAAGKFGVPVGEHFKLIGDLMHNATSAVKTDKFIQSYMHLHWRRFGAADAYFREMRFAMSLSSEARVLAMKEGASDVHARAVELLKDPSQNPSMVARAFDDALRSTFNKDNSFATGIHMFQSKLGPVGKTATNVLVPFVRTVANVAEAMVDYTPVLGFVKELTMGDHTARSILMGFGRNVTGGGVFALGYYLAKQGLITGSGIGSTPEKQMMESQGKGPYSFRSKADGTWRDYNRLLGPISMPLAAGANWYAMEQDARTGPGHSAMDKAMRFANQGVSQLADQAPGGQLSQLSAHQEQDGAHMIANTVGQIGLGAAVPAIVANTAKGLDPNERATDTYLDRLKARIPGVRETLPVKKDATGRAIPRAEGLLPTLADPSNPHQERNDPVLSEMQRLGLNYTQPASTGTYLPQEQMERFRAGLTRNTQPERYDRDPATVRAISEAAGPETMATLTRLMSQPSYQNASDELKRQIVSGIIDGLRSKATILYELKNPQPVTPPVTFP